MIKTINTDLLRNEEVKQEIEKHKWIESEKAGYDIGYEKAAEDWLNRYSAQWTQKHLNKTGKAKRSAKRIF